MSSPHSACSCSATAALSPSLMSPDPALVGSGNPDTSTNPTDRVVQAATSPGQANGRRNAQVAHGSHSGSWSASSIPRAFLPAPSPAQQSQPQEDEEEEAKNLVLPGSTHSKGNETSWLAYRERVLRKGINYIQAQEHMTANQKSQNIQRLMSSNRWIPTFDSVADLTSIIDRVVETKTHSTQHSPSSMLASNSAHSVHTLMDYSECTSAVHVQDPQPAPPAFIPTVSQADSQPSFTDATRTHLGCSHYQRACKSYASCCNKWVTCHICHEIEQDHTMNRCSVSHIMCMHCALVQEPSQTCKGCATEFASYYCSACKLWESNDEKQIFHCTDCGICRTGGRSNFVHCSRCNCCLSGDYFQQHRCIERSLECDCPICGDYLFTSMHPVMFMLCGHAIHSGCFCKMELRNSHQCPICQKSVRDMRWLYSRLDSVLEAQQMPEEYARDKSLILCNDCERRGEAKYHFLYHKCQHCSSYNTKLIEVIKGS